MTMALHLTPGGGDRRPYRVPAHHRGACVLALVFAAACASEQRSSIAPTGDDVQDIVAWHGPATLSADGSFTRDEGPALAQLFEGIAVSLQSANPVDAQVTVWTEPMSMRGEQIKTTIRVRTDRLLPGRYEVRFHPPMTWAEAPPGSARAEVTHRPEGNEPWQTNEYREEVDGVLHITSRRQDRISGDFRLTVRGGGSEAVLAGRLQEVPLTVLD
jgi:hypothetical protein